MQKQKNLKKTTKRVFRKLSNVQHVRMRTGMWLGQNSLTRYMQHFFTKKHSGQGYDIADKEIEELPAKLKCLDEACMNAVDEYNRLLQKNWPKKNRMTELVVQLSHNDSRVSICDDGRGIPFANAEHVFLHLMYGENFNDETRKEHIAGQNGVGISLVRMVSKFFYVRSVHDGDVYEKRFTPTTAFRALIENAVLAQTFSKNFSTGLFLYFDEHGSLENCHELKQKDLKLYKQLLKEEKRSGMRAIKRPAPAGEHGTEVAFELDERYFGMHEVSFDPALLAQYLQDLAMTNPGLSVVFQHKDHQQKFFFKKGLEEILQFGKQQPPYYKLIHEDATHGFFLESFLVAAEGRTLSWVNGNFISLGGSPIEYFENRLCDELRKKPALLQAEKKLSLTASRNDVRSCFHVYHTFRVNQPRFRSQDKSYFINDLKEILRLAIDEHLERIIRKLDLVNAVKAKMQKRSQVKEFLRAEKDLRHTNRSLIPKFVAANSRSAKDKKTLIIAEGDSALASLRPVRDPKLHALFPLRGKPLNVRGMPLAKAMLNQEVRNIISIINLPLQGDKLKLEQLHFRYICIMTDADYDGYAIRSLILSFFFEYWPKIFSLDLIYVAKAPLYEVEILNKAKQKKIFYCQNDSEYKSLIEKTSSHECQLLRKKRNKGLGETSRAAMLWTLAHGFYPIAMAQETKARNLQNLWFHKDYAAQRRKAISSYKNLFLEE